MRISDWSSDVCSSDLAANMNINTVGSAKLIAKTVRTGGSVSSSGGSSVTTAPTPNKITQNVANAAVDPLAGSSDVSSAIAQIGTYTNVMSGRTEEHTSELQSLMRISYAVFYLKKKN